MSAPLQHRLRPGNQHNMKHLQSILLLILLALAGGHTVSFGQTALASAGWELGAQANAAVAKPEAKWQKHVQLNHAYADEFVLTYDHVPDHLEYTNDNYHKPVAERTIDNEDITPLTWKWVRLEMPEAGGSVMTACLRRPDWWLTANQADVLGNWVALSLPEMGIQGKAQVKEIIPSYVDTRFADFPATGNLKYRPITGWFARTVPEVWNYVFTSGDTIGATPNHPFFSEDRQAYIAIGDLSIGERVKLEGEVAATLHTKWKRENGQETVYNLEVWRDHNFHVGKGGVLVHNSCDVKDAFGQFGIKALDNIVIDKTLDKIPDQYLPHGEIIWTTKARKTDKFTQEFEYEEIRIAEIIGQIDGSKIHLAPSNNPGFDAIRESDGKILSFKGMTGTTAQSNIDRLQDNIELGLKKYKENAHINLPDNLKETVKCEIWISGKHATNTEIFQKWEEIKTTWAIDLDDYKMIDKIYYIGPEDGPPLLLVF